MLKGDPSQLLKPGLKSNLLPRLVFRLRQWSLVPVLNRPNPVNMRPFRSAHPMTELSAFPIDLGMATQGCQCDRIFWRIDAIDTPTTLVLVGMVIMTMNGRLIHCPVGIGSSRPEAIGTSLPGQTNRSAVLVTGTGDL